MKIIFAIIALALFTTCTIWPQENVQKEYVQSKVVLSIPVQAPRKVETVRVTEVKRQLALPTVQTNAAFKAAVSEETSKPLKSIPKEVMLTIYYEANGQPIKGQYAVYCVIKNRSLVSGKSEKKIATDPEVFDPWKNKNPSKVRMNRSIRSFDQNIRNLTEKDIRTTAVEQRIYRYATYFHSPRIRRKRGLSRNPPFFHKKNVVVLGMIGEHVFYCFKDEMRKRDRFS